ncbi:Uma2 family endonuclease [Methylosinus sp. H3A]|uniref:Uma2 family endonuclease n=1 Tax=Methylosinus sp. H3A TaxID=2785786 RepID=UPI0018C24CEB|nr:Uma2 family endonuclease [Methylosinus sp. H3A]MBG0810948.1 Uma2 family endonuclease [Methylosinus sp. H3A]
MTAPAGKLMTIPEFLAWSERHDEGRYELANGEIVAMPRERPEQVTAKGKIWRAVAEALARAGAPCEAYVGGLGVAVDAHTVYEPDILVNCGDPIATEEMLAPAPIVIVELLWPPSDTNSESVKLTDYFRVGSLAHYLVVDLARRAVLHCRRDAESIFRRETVTEGSIRLDPPGFDLALKDIFA